MVLPVRAGAVDNSYRLIGHHRHTATSKALIVLTYACLPLWNSRVSCACIHPGKQIDDSQAAVGLSASGDGHQTDMP
jgi:hypothetical protein